MRPFFIYNDMKIIYPYDLSEVTIESLVYDKKIIHAKDNKSWQATIFHNSKKLNLISTYDKDHIITQVDDELFKDFILLERTEQTVFTDNNTKRDYIKCIEIGDYNDSVKRYTQLDKPIDYNNDAQTFLNIPQYDYSQTNNYNVGTDLIYKTDINVDDILPQKKPMFFDQQTVDHPHINTYDQNNTSSISKYNNKAFIEQVLKWAKEKGILYIYCINEYRPHIMNTSYTTPYVYYTIKGAYGVAQGSVIQGESQNIIDEFDNDIIDEFDDDIIW